MESNSQNSAITCWLLDARTIWPGERIEQAAPDALKLLSPEERANVVRKYHIQDARMSLASALLKRLYICKTLNVPWNSIQFSRRGDPKHGKPCYLPPDSTASRLDFNVSHQAGLVALIGCHGANTELGVDIVCVNERDDYRTIDTDGFDGWVDIYEEFFSAEELWDMKYNIDSVTLLDGTVVSAEELGRHDRCCRRDRQLTVKLKSGEERTFSSELLIEAKLRRFYTFWCYKEAYIKLTGEAMMASWLRQVEFRNVRAPRPGTVPRCSTHGTWGEKLDDVEVWLHEERVEDVRMEIQAFEEYYMIAAAVRPAAALGTEGVPGFVRVDVERDIMAVAESSSEG